MSLISIRFRCRKCFLDKQTISFDLCFYHSTFKMIFCKMANLLSKTKESKPWSYSLLFADVNRISGVSGTASNCKSSLIPYIWSSLMCRSESSSILSLCSWGYLLLDLFYSLLSLGFVLWSTFFRQLFDVGSERKFDLLLLYYFLRLYSFIRFSFHIIFLFFKLFMLIFWWYLSGLTCFLDCSCVPLALYSYYFPLPILLLSFFYR